MLTARPSGSSAIPVCCSTVTPGKLATFWRSPVRRLKRVVLPELGGPTSATVRTAAGRGEFHYGRVAATVAAAAIAHGILGVRGLRLGAIATDFQTARGVAAQRDFRTIHLEDARIAAGGAESRGDAGAGNETQFHQAAGIFGGQIDAVEDGGVAFSQIHEACVRRFQWTLLPLSCNMVSVCSSPKSLSRGCTGLPRFFLAMVSQRLSKYAKIKDNRMAQRFASTSSPAARPGPDPGNRGGEFRRRCLRSQPVCRIHPQMRGPVSGRRVGY